MQVRYALRNVVLGTEQTLKHKETGKSFTLNGDGRLDAFMMNDSHSASAVQSIEDPRIKALAAELLPLLGRDNVTPRESYTEMISRHLGQQWTPADIHRRTVTTTLPQGDLTIGVTFDNYSIDKPEAITLWASKVEGDSQVTQGVYKDKRSPEPVESLTWVPSQKAADAELARLNESLAAYARSQI